MKQLLSLIVAFLTLVLSQNVAAREQAKKTAKKDVIAVRCL